MISPLFKVRDYTVKDVNCFDIKVLSTSDEPNGYGEKHRITC